MARDDFSKQTIDILAKRVGVRCSNPSCRKLTTGPRSESRHIVNIGVGAHITAATEGGPRFDRNLSTDQRQSPENGIWLCQNCAKLIDNDPTRYAVDVLSQWKVQAENAALAEIEGRIEAMSPEILAEIEISYRVVRKESERHDYQLEIVLKNLGTEPLGQYHIDVMMPTRVIHNVENQFLYVRDRSTHDRALFRLVSEKHRPKEVLYPGDARPVLSVQYFVDNKLFQSRDAIHIATALAMGCNAILTNDTGWRVVMEIEVLVLEDFIEK